MTEPIFPGDPPILPRKTQVARSKKGDHQKHPHSEVSQTSQKVLNSSPPKEEGFNNDASGIVQSESNVPQNVQTSEFEQKEATEDPPPTLPRPRSARLAQQQIDELPSKRDSELPPPKRDSEPPPKRDTELPPKKEVEMPKKEKRGKHKQREPSIYEDPMLEFLFPSRVSSAPIIGMKSSGAPTPPRSPSNFPHFASPPRHPLSSVEYLPPILAVGTQTTKTSSRAASPAVSSHSSTSLLATLPVASFFELPPKFASPSRSSSNGIPLNPKTPSTHPLSALPAVDPKFTSPGRSGSGLKQARTRSASPSRPRKSSEDSSSVFSPVKFPSIKFATPSRASSNSSSSPARLVAISPQVAPPRNDFIAQVQRKMKEVFAILPEEKMLPAAVVNQYEKLHNGKEDLDAVLKTYRLVVFLVSFCGCTRDGLQYIVPPSKDRARSSSRTPNLPLSLSRESTPFLPLSREPTPISLSRDPTPAKGDNQIKSTRRARGISSQPDQGPMLVPPSPTSTSFSPMSVSSTASAESVNDGQLLTSPATIHVAAPISPLGVTTVSAPVTPRSKSESKNTGSGRSKSSRRSNSGSNFSIKTSESCKRSSSIDNWRAPLHPPSSMTTQSNSVSPIQSVPAAFTSVPASSQTATGGKSNRKRSEKAKTKMSTTPITTNNPTPSPIPATEQNTTSESSAVLSPDSSSIKNSKTDGDVTPTAPPQQVSLPVDTPTRRRLFPLGQDNATTTAPRSANSKVYNQIARKLEVKAKVLAMLSEKGTAKLSSFVQDYGEYYGDKADLESVLKGLRLGEFLISYCGCIKISVHHIVGPQSGGDQKPSSPPTSDTPNTATIAPPSIPSATFETTRPSPVRGRRHGRNVNGKNIQPTSPALTSTSTTLSTTASSSAAK